MLNKKDIKNAEIYFNKYARPDGKLNQFQFNQLFYALGVKNLSPGAFKTADLDNDGTVDKAEFMKYYAFLKNSGSEPAKKN